MYLKCGEMEHFLTISGDVNRYNHYEKWTLFPVQEAAIWSMFYYKCMYFTYFLKLFVLHL